MSANERRTMNKLMPRAKRFIATAAVIAGLGAGAAGVASAATTGATTTQHTSAAPANRPPGPPGNPANMTHGPGETLLTGTNLSSAVAAAHKAEPDATVVRAETDSSGKGTYEVHLKKADGTYVTVELDSSFNVSGTETGFGPGPAGTMPPPPSTVTN